MSSEARSASTFGVLLGRKDTSGACLEQILSATRQTRSSLLMRGYVSGLLQHSPGQRGRISQLLDELERIDPEMAAEIIVADLDATDPVTRLIRLVRDGKLGEHYLQYLHYGLVLKNASSEQVAELIDVLTPVDSPSESVKTAVELISDRMRCVELGEEAPGTVAAIKRVLHRSAVILDRVDYLWGEAMQYFVSAEPHWTAEVACAALCGDYSKWRVASAILGQLAAENPVVVMKILGDAILDPQKGGRGQILPNPRLFSFLPASVVMDWLTITGLDGARRVARHLPLPAVAEDGALVVPELTERVLVAFGDDDRVFRECLAGRDDLEAKWGPVSAHEEKHAQVARAFLNHHLPIIRKWAERSLARAEESAKLWSNIEEDEDWG